MNCETKSGMGAARLAFVRTIGPRVVMNQIRSGLLFSEKPSPGSVRVSNSRIR